MLLGAVVLWYPHYLSYYPTMILGSNLQEQNKRFLQGWAWGLYVCVCVHARVHAGQKSVRKLQNSVEKTYSRTFKLKKRGKNPKTQVCMPKAKQIGHPQLL